MHELTEHEKWLRAAREAKVSRGLMRTKHFADVAKEVVSAEPNIPVDTKPSSAPREGPVGASTTYRYYDKEKRQKQVAEAMKRYRQRKRQKKDLATKLV
jgi:hypothetical protein